MSSLPGLAGNAPQRGSDDEYLNPLSATFPPFSATLSPANAAAASFSSPFPAPATAAAVLQGPPPQYQQHPQLPQLPPLQQLQQLQQFQQLQQQQQQQQQQAPPPRKTVRFQIDSPTAVSCTSRSRPPHQPKDRHNRQGIAATGAQQNGRRSTGSSSSNTSANTSNGNSSSDDDDSDTVARPTLLQPRVAVVLGLPSLWHLPLFASRSLSVCPAIWWSLGIMIRLLVQLHALFLAREEAGALRSRPPLSLESRLKLTETALAMIWCGASAYLSFFFTDCLMSRWLLNYTPQATIVRLLAINALNAYLTSWVIYLAGSGGDSRLLLPAWIAIATILTALYHVTQRKINIRKETSISISVFSGASFISMASLLAQLYWDRPEYANVPVVSLARRLCTETVRIAGNVFDIGNITMDIS